LYSAQLGNTIDLGKNSRLSDSEVDQIPDSRNQVLLEAFERHPERLVTGPAKKPRVPGGGLEQSIPASARKKASRDQVSSEALADPIFASSNSFSC
jgi:hypothetical protein